jgi:hypothetical protein
MAVDCKLAESGKIGRVLLIVSGTLLPPRPLDFCPHLPVPVGLVRLDLFRCDETGTDV